MDKAAHQVVREAQDAGVWVFGGLAFAPAAMAMVYGIQGDDEVQLEWLDIAAEMRRVVEPAGRPRIYGPAFDGMVALHRGEIGVALTHVAADPGSFKLWHDAAWRPWYTAVWAEAGVLADLPDRRSRLDRARFVVRGNPISSAIVDRAEAIAIGDTSMLVSLPPPSTPQAAGTNTPARSSSPAARPGPKARRSWPRSAPHRWHSERTPSGARMRAYRLGSDRGSPNQGSMLFSKRVKAQIRSPVRVRTNRPLPWRMPLGARR